MDLSLKGKRALITAGAAGIGRAIADTFVKNGARVQVCDVDEKALSSLAKDIFKLKADARPLTSEELVGDVRWWPVYGWHIVYAVDDSAALVTILAII